MSCCGIHVEADGLDFQRCHHAGPSRRKTTRAGLQHLQAVLRARTREGRTGLRHKDHSFRNTLGRSTAQQGERGAHLCCAATSNTCNEMKPEAEPFINHFARPANKSSRSSCHACVAKDCSHVASPVAQIHAYGYAGGRLPAHFWHHCPCGSHRPRTLSTQKWNWMNPPPCLLPQSWTRSALPRSSSPLTRRTLASPR
jgi:hypothetical protein